MCLKSFETVAFLLPILSSLSVSSPLALHSPVQCLQIYSTKMLRIMLLYIDKIPKFLPKLVWRADFGNFSFFIYKMYIFGKVIHLLKNGFGALILAIFQILYIECIYLRK